MGKRWISVLLVVGLMGLLGLREWLVHEEIQSLQADLSAKIQSQFQSAMDRERLDNLSSAPVVFDRFVEPVILAANKLLWPFSRDAIVSEWRREVYPKIDEATFSQIKVISQTVEAQIRGTRETDAPSVARLQKILDLKIQEIAHPEMKEVVQVELKQISEEARRQDMQALNEIREKGLAVLASFQKRIKGMGPEKLSRFFSSGDYHREVQQPILDLVLSLKQEETRKNTWLEFQKKMLEQLSQKKSRLMGKSKGTKDLEIAAESKRMEKLFNQVADAIKRDDEPAVESISGSKLQVDPAPESEFTPEYGSPAGLDYHND